MTVTRCPLCGQPMHRLAPGWERVTMEAYQFGNMLIQPGTEYHRKEPSGLSDNPEKVKASLQRSLITGVVFGIGGCSVAVLRSAPIITAIIISVLTTCGGFGMTWLWLLRDDRRLLWKVERIIGADLDGDDEIGEPESEPALPPPIFLHQRNRYVRHESPFSDWDEAHRVAVAVLLRGYGFTRRQLVEAGALPDDPEYYTGVYNAMLGAQLMVKNGNGGILTDEGREYLATFLPTPLARRVSGNGGQPTNQLPTNR